MAWGKRPGEVPRLHYRSLSGHGGPRCSASNTGGTSRRSCGSLELQSGEMRLVLSRSERHAEIDVHDAAEHAPAGYTCDRRTHEGISSHKGSGHGRIVELPGKEAHPEVPAAAAGCTRWHLAHCARGCRTGTGVSQVHRVLSL